MSSVQGISIIIPTWNEEQNIQPLVSRISRSLSRAKIPYELIFVDDHSSDETVSVIHKLSALYPIALYQKIDEKGKARSLLEGFTYAKYSIVSMIDADLQYPPEILPLMLNKIKKGADIVVANRKQSRTNIIRRIVSYSFSFLFAKLLHNFSVDVQSGLKVFKKHVLQKIEIHPSPWSFDLEFLLTARNVGFVIDSVDITFEKRNSGTPKINIIKASFEVGLSALKLKFRQLDTMPFSKLEEKKRGKGFRHKGMTFIHHSFLPSQETAYYKTTPFQKNILLLLALLLLIGIHLNWIATVTFIVGVLTFIYFYDLLFNLFLIIRSFHKPPEIKISDEEVRLLNSADLPLYTIFCPLYQEWDVLPQFVTAISRLDYPKDKLQVLLLLEEDDKETIRHIQSYALPAYFQIIIVPHSLPKTKPKALNYGLQFAKGDYSVIYDAEDIPDPLQLKKVIIAFNKSGEKIVCIQAKLNFYNPHHNLLTRIFTAEYSLWFDLVLTGLQSIHAPIPLGGTSNHFRTKDLHTLKGWDSFNVTEDCDLGLRLAKKGYQTALIDSLTLEEANSDIPNWFQQRTRWIKGYMQTYFVHMRNIRLFLRNNKHSHFLAFQLIIGGKVLSMFINPLMWLTTISYFAFRPHVGVFIEQFFPAPILYMGVTCLVFGNFLYMYYYMIGCAKRKDYDLIKYIFLVPFYWLAMSVAAWHALIQLIRKPHFWPKTIHGFHLESEKAFQQATLKIGKKLIDRSIATPDIFVPSLAFSAKPKDSKTWSISTLSSGTVLLASMMIANFLNFLFNAYLGRTISFEDFGLLTLINTLWYLLGVFVSPLGSTVNHRVAYLFPRTGQAGANAFYLSTFKRIVKVVFIFAIIWLFFTPVLANFFNLQSISPLILFAPIFLFGPIASINQGYLNGNFFFLWIGFAVLASSLTKLGVAVGLTSLHLDSMTYLAIPLSIVVSLTTTSIIIFNKLRLAKIDRTTHYSFPKRFYVASIISGLSTTAFLTFDVILTKHFFLPRIAGEYAFLSLVGKMIFFFGSILNVFIIPFISRDMGANKDPNKSFYRLLSGTIVLTIGMYLTIGIFGHKLIPLLFGEKAYPILVYLPSYALAIAIFVISNSITSYHLVRHHYSFPATSLLLSTAMSFGIILFHENISQITRVMLATSIASLVILICLHILQRNGRFLLRNLVDLAGLFLPLLQQPPLKPTGKRILVFNWRDLKHKFAGGAEVYLHELAKRWVTKGNQVTLFCGNDGHCLRNEVIDGVQIIRRGGFYFVYLWAFLYYFFRFRGKYDVIIDCENGIPFFAPLYAREKVFCLMFHVHQEVFRRSLIKPLAHFASVLENKFMPWIYRNNKFITISESSKKEIEKLGLGKAGIEVVFPGVDLNLFQPAAKSKTPIVLYLGRLKFYKSINIFIKAAYKVLKTLPNVKFMIAGEGEEMPGLLRLAKKLGLERKIKFLGKVTESEKIKLYQKAWVVVNTSLMEGWGITTIEANACGTPVVASDVPGLRDSVNNPHNGILVTYGDVNEFAKQITNLIKDNILRTKMSSEAIDWAQRFDWQKSADKSLDILK